MSEERAPYAALPAEESDQAGWRASLMAEIEKAVKNWNRPAIIVVRFDGSGAWQVMPAAPTARIEMGKG